MSQVGRLLDLQMLFEQWYAAKTIIFGETLMERCTGEYFSTFIS